MKQVRNPRWLLLALVLLASAGCAQIVPLEGVLGGVMGGTVTGEVRQVDHRSRRIQVITHGRRSEVVSYDGRTRVVYGGRDYPVRALERGDVVTMRVREDGRRRLHADLIQVRQAVQDRRGGDVYGRRVQRLEGTVGWVDTRRGEFELRPRRGSSVVVYLPRDARRADVARFRRLRSGNRVRVEGVQVERRVIELQRFR